MIKLFFRIIGLCLITVLFPISLLWLWLHDKSWTIFSEWCLYGCKYENTDFHKYINSKLGINTKDFTETPHY